MRLISLMPLALSLGVIPACGEGDGSGGGSGLPLEELPAGYAAALCSAYQNCYGDLLELLRPGEDCVENTTIRLEDDLATLPNAVEAGRVKYDGVQAQRCLDDVAAASCELLSEREPESCKPALEGTVETGGECELDAECEGDQYCDISDSCPGVCAELEAAGGPCRGNSDCSSGLKCSEVTSRCVTPAREGEACKGGEPDCVDGFFCLGDDAAANMPGECVAFADAFGAKAGEPCGSEIGLCELGLVCAIEMLNPARGTCAEKVGSGDTCPAAFPDACPDDEYCTAINILTREGTCTSKPEPSEPCGMSLGGALEICAPGARCDTGVCRALARPGESCTANSTCYSEHCLDQACVAASTCE
jgi:hypothetical protein